MDSEACGRDGLSSNGDIQAGCDGPSERHLRIFFEQSADLLCIIGFDGNFDRLNDRWQEVLGYKREQLLNRPLQDIVHPDERSATMEAIRQLTVGQSSAARFENRLRTRDGQYCWLEWSAQSAPDEQLIFASVRDVTGRKKTQTFFHVVVESSSAGLMIVDPGGKITRVNRQMESQFGYFREELVGMSVEHLIPERFRQEHSHLMKGFFASPSATLMGEGRDLYGLRKDGSEFLVEVTLKPFSIDESQFVLCTLIDISGRKKQELELTRQIRELDRHRLEMDTLSEMSSLLQHAVTPEEVYTIVDGFSSQLFGGVAAGVYTLPPSGNYFRLTSSWGGFPGSEILQSRDCWALRLSRTHHSSKASTPSCLHWQGNPTDYSICIPMAAHGQQVGLVHVILEAAKGDERVDELDRLGHSVADQLALALSNLELRKQLENLSMRDSLTDLFNRRYLEETVSRELDRIVRKGGKLGVVMLDADHFKAYNDAHGHQAGDDALRLIARVFKTQTRQSDICCRYGGEEFVLLFPDCSMEETVARTESLRSAIHQESSGKFSISAGVAEYPRHGEDWATLLHAADVALYGAKAAGRDRVITAPSAEATTDPVFQDSCSV